MRFPVSQKISLGVALILLIGSLSMVLVYQGLTAIERTLDKLAEIEEPTITATNEMEINSNGITLGVLKYLDAMEPRYRKLVEYDEADFESFHARYLQLAESQTEKELGRKIGDLYNELKAVGRAVMDKRVEQEAIFAAITQDAEKMDDIIDSELRPKMDPRNPNRSIRNSIEADIAQVGMWLSNYERTRNPKYKGLISSNERDSDRRWRASRV
jgi:hypothetical protein